MHKKLEMKKRRMEERVKRIFDYKAPAVDLEVVEQQVIDNKKSIEEERKLDEKKDVALLKWDQMLLEREKAKRALQREERAQVESYWRIQEERKPMRPEADLNDPRQLSKDFVPNLKTAGPSSAQFFDGDKELVLRAMEKVKMKQQATMLRDQEKEIERLRELEKKAEQRFAEMNFVEFKTKGENEKKSAEERRAQNEAQKVANGNLIAIRKQLADAEKDWENQVNKIENETIAGSPFLQEIRRNFRQDWKGMTPAELEMITKEQGRQMVQNKEKHAAETELLKRQDAEYEERRNALMQFYNDKAATNREAAKTLQAVRLMQKDEGLQRRREQLSYDKEPQETWFPFGRCGR